MKIKGMLLIIILSMPLMRCRTEKFDPWGVWNVNYAEEEIAKFSKIRTFSTGKYYEVPFGLYIVKHCDEAITSKNKFPAFVIPGEFTEIEKYKRIENGYIFHLIGPGFKYTSEEPKFQDGTRIQVKMQFIDKDECYFEYVDIEDANGFHLSYLAEENKIYKRYRVNKENKKIFDVATLQNPTPETEDYQTQ